MENTRGISENTVKGLQVIPDDSWPLHGVRGASDKLFLVVVAQDPHLFVSLSMIVK